jgi:hypothetical protein
MYCGCADGSGLRHLSSMSRLRELRLHGSFEMTPTGLATLQQVSKCDLSCHVAQDPPAVCAKPIEHLWREHYS